MSAEAASNFIRVGTVEQLNSRGVMVVAGADRPIAVFVHDGGISAVDNRCPHMGFPLHKGSVRDGILTCHWHEARFDLCSGCTFDLWADDVPAYDTEVRDGAVYVARRPRRVEDGAHYLHRLRHGLEHDVSLIEAKGILGLVNRGAGGLEIVREIAQFGGRHHDRWDQGMTILSIVANLMPCLSRETAYYALLRAARQVAADCRQAVPHRRREPMPGTVPAGQLIRWMRNWVQGRHRDGAERVLLTAIETLGPSRDLANLVFTAASDRVYSQVGHVFDMTNKAFELLDKIGWQSAADLLPLVLERTVTARGGEEDVHWHHPVEIIDPLREIEHAIPALLDEGRGKHWAGDAALPDLLLREDPLRILAALRDALRNGARPHELSKLVAYAAALRLARFSLTNEVDDWFNPRHTFIFANAVHRAVARCPSPGVVRGIFHGAMAVYMDRFLNVPAAKLPHDLQHLPHDPAELRKQLLSTLDRRAEVESAAALVARYVRLGHPIDDLIETLALATVREDLDFHPLQVLEAGIQQYHEWETGPEAVHVLVGVVRQLAAVCPTPRAAHQTATIALRLDRGERLYDEEEE